MALRTFAARLSMCGLALGLLGGCTALSGEGHLLTEDARLAAHVRSCCSSPSELLRRQPVETAASRPALLWFAASTPHFDFGNGLAPFTVFQLNGPAPTAQVELRSPMRLRGWAYGGDGKAHYADAIALFFDANGNPLPVQPIERTQRADSAGVTALFQTVPVPAAATHLVVTSNPRTTGLTDADAALGPPDRAEAAGAGPSMRPGSLFALGYRLATYGPVQIRLVE
jgi:hypothetical protein